MVMRHGKRILRSWREHKHEFTITRSFHVRAKSNSRMQIIPNQPLWSSGAY